MEDEEERYESREDAGDEGAEEPFTKIQAAGKLRSENVMKFVRSIEAHDRPSWWAPKTQRLQSATMVLTIHRVVLRYVAVFQPRLVLEKRTIKS